MNKCFKCGCEFEGEFCPQCGTKYQKEKICPNCNSTVCGSVKFCNHCGYSFEREITETSRPKRETVVRNPFPIWSILAKVLPQVSMYAFALFSLLLWAFFSAPFASIFGASLGNVYTTLNGSFDDYLKIAQASIAFGVISLVYAIVTITLSFIPKTNNITVGKLNLIKLLSVCGNVLYVPFFALGCAVISKSKEIGTQNGSFSSLIIAFSIVFAVISIGSLIADILLRRNVPAYFEAINSNAQAKAEREEHKRQILAERRANAESILAEKGIVSPTEVEHPDTKIKNMIKRFIGGIYRELFIFVSLTTLSWFIACAVFYEDFNLITLFIGVVLFIISAVLGITALSRMRFYKLSAKNGLYQKDVELLNATTIKRSVKSNKIALIICGGLGLIIVISIIALYISYLSNVRNVVSSEDFEKYFKSLKNRVELLWILLGLTIFAIGVLLCNYVRGKRIKRIFGLDGKNKPQYYVLAEKEEVPLTIELFCKQNYDYDMYCKDLRYYNYNVRRVSSDKPSVDRPQYNKCKKKIKAIVTACISVAVALAIVIGVVVDSQNIFKESKIRQIHNGMTKDEVVKVLGETEFASDYTWNYYSSNFVKLMREAEDLSKQMANAQDFEQVLKIQQQIDELQKKMQNSTYKYITVTFDSDGKVTDVKYDFNYNPSKSAEARSSLGIKILI